VYRRTGGEMKDLLLSLPSLATLLVPFYNSDTPRLFGFPFFYWFLIVLIPASSLVTYLVYKGEKR
jgi:hypothetical protein